MKALFPAVFSLFILSACEKEPAKPHMCFDGVIRWQGEPAADGLGWTIYEDDSITTKPFIPRNLPDEYKAHHLKVHVCMYRTAEKFYCHCVQPLDKYHITFIRRR